MAGGMIDVSSWHGKTSTARSLSCNSPEYLQQRHGFLADLLKNIAGIAALIQKAVE